MCLKVGMYTCVGAHEGQAHQISWSYSYGHLWATWHGCWGLRSRPLKEQWEFCSLSHLPMPPQINSCRGALPRSTTRNFQRPSLLCDGLMDTKVVVQQIRCNSSLSSMRDVCSVFMSLSHNGPPSGKQSSTQKIWDFPTWIGNAGCVSCCSKRQKSNSNSCRKGKCIAV